MLIKVKLDYPKIVKNSRTVEIEIEDGMAQVQVEEWIWKNRQKILKENGCKLSKSELASAIANSEASVNIVF